MADARQMYIDGEWVEAQDGRRFDTFDPATGSVLATVPAGSAADVDRAARAARRAFDGDGSWGMAVPERERSRVLFAMAELVRDRRDALAELEVRDCGKPLVDARADIDEVAFMFEYYGGWATKIAGDIPPVGPGRHELGGEGAGGSVRSHRPVELPDAHGQPEGGTRAGGRVHGGAQARRADAADRARAGPDRSGRRAARWGAQRGHRARARGRRTAAHSSCGRQDQLHRVQGDREAHHAHLCRSAEAGHARAGGQEPEHRVRRRRPGRRGARHQQRCVRQPG